MTVMTLPFDTCIPLYVIMYLYIHAYIFNTPT